MLGLSDAGWVVVGGVATAFIGGAFTFAGVVVSTVAQRKPSKAKLDPAAQAEADLAAMTMDRDRWRAVAETFMPRRREEDLDVEEADDTA